MLYSCYTHQHGLRQAPPTPTPDRGKLHQSPAQGGRGNTDITVHLAITTKAGGEDLGPHIMYICIYLYIYTYIYIYTHINGT